MEDFLLIQGRFRNRNDEDLFAVFDGHAGAEAGQFVATHFGPYLEQVLCEMEQWTAEELMTECDHAGVEVDPPQAIKVRDCAKNALALHRTFQRTRNELHRRDVDCGTTVLVAFFSGDHLYIANAGDTRAVLALGSGEYERLSVDHRPDCPAERLRIEATGGQVIFSSVPRVEGLLAVSRAIGDFDLEPKGLSWRPSIRVRESTMTPDGIFIVLASDGLWDVVSDGEAVKMVSEQLAVTCEHRHGQHCDCQALEAETRACRKLVEHAYDLKSIDNISVVLIKLTEAEIPTSSHDLASAVDNDVECVFELQE